jgi:hypothetical protein
LYGGFQSALLWYKMLTETILEKGFTQNEYIRCLGIKMVYCAILYSSILRGRLFIKQHTAENTCLEEKYVPVENEHVYLGIKMNFNREG